jgi:hypothetical protein
VDTAISFGIDVSFFSFEYLCLADFSPGDFFGVDASNVANVSN